MDNCACGRDDCDDVNRRVHATLMRAEFADLFPQYQRQARWRYFSGPGQRLYAWTTEKVNGKYAAIEYHPTGPGSRTGKAQRWTATRTVRFRRRKDAKARALLWREKAEAKEAAA